MRTVSADVQIGAAMAAVVPEPDSLAGGQRDLDLAREAAHASQGAPRGRAWQASHGRRGAGWDILTGVSDPLASRRAHPGLPVVALLSLLVLAAPVRAQGTGQPTLAELALDWARGRFATPVICEFAGRPVRGIRRVLIGPGPARVQPPVDKIVFVDLDADDASRCFTELGGDSPNITGSIQIRLPGNWRPELAARDFREQLRRKQGFEFDVPAGGLRIGKISQPPGPSRVVDFRGGSVSLRALDPGSDSERLLADFESPRKLLLELSARDGTKLSFPLYMTDLR